MKTHKTIFILLLSINSLAILLLFGFNLDQAQNRNLQNNANTSSAEPTLEYQFKEPMMAYQVLSALDVFEPIDLGLTAKRTKMYYTSTLFLGMQTDDNYCEKHRYFFVFNPEVVMKQKKFHHERQSWLKSQISGPSRNWRERHNASC